MTPLLLAALLLPQTAPADPSYGKYFAREAREVARLSKAIVDLAFVGPTKILAVAEAPDGERSWMLPDLTVGPDRSATRRLLLKRRIARWDGIEVSVEDPAGGPSLARFGGDRPVGFSSSGDALFTLGPDGRLTRHSLPDGKVAAQLPADPEFDFRAALSPDGRLLLRGSRTFAFKIVDAASGDLILELPPCKGRADAMAFSPDGSLLALAWIPGVLELWDLDAGARICHLEGLQRMPASLRFDPAGRTLAFSSIEDPIIDILTVSPFRVRLRLTLNGHECAPWVLAFSQDSRSLLSGDLKGRILLWPVAPFREDPLPPVGDVDEILSGEAAAFQNLLPSLAADPAAVANATRVLETAPLTLAFAREALRPAALSAPESIRRMRALRILDRAGAVDVLSKVGMTSPSPRERQAAQDALSRR